MRRRALAIICVVVVLASIGNAPPGWSAPPPRHQLTVNLTGSGSGLVTSDPSGISCPPTCQQRFRADTVVTLTATPDSTSTFAGWQDDGCGGGTTCVVSMTSARTVGATFVDQQSGDVALWSTSPASPSAVETPVVTGEAPIGATVALYAGSCGGTAIGTGTAPDGTFSIEVAVPPDQTTTIRASATVAGATTPCSAGLAYREDSSAPPAPTITGTDPGSPSGSGQPTILGAAEPGATVHLYTGATCAVAVGEGRAPAGAFAIPVTVTPDSATVLSARATDEAGNVGPCSAGLAYRHDSTPPLPPTGLRVTPVGPANENRPMIHGAAEASASVSLHATADCADEPIAVGAATAAGFAVTVAVGDGTTTTLWAKATDLAGNVGACSSVSATYVEDSSLPLLPSITASEPPSPSPERTPTFVGVAAPGASVSLYRSANCSGRAVGSAVATDGTFAIAVTVPRNSSSLLTVRAGGSPCSNPFTYRADGTSPAAPLLAGALPASGADENAPAIVGAAEPRSVVRLFGADGCTGAPIAELVAAANGNFSSSLAVPDDSETVVSASAVDEAGNASRCSAFLSYLEDSSTPEPPHLHGTTPPSPSGATDPVIHGTAEAGAAVRLFATADCSGDVIGIAPNGGAFAVAGSVPPGTPTSFSALASDAAGHVSGCSTPIEYVADTSPPAAPVLSSTTPTSPANEDQPVVSGTAEPGTRVDLYFGSCEGTPAVSFDGGAFSVAVLVPDDAATTMRAVAVDEVENASPCSEPLVYVEDSTAPPAPSVDDVVPASPANDNAPAVSGTAEPGSTVRILVGGEGCAAASTAASVVASSTDGSFAATFAVADDTLTVFWVAAIDAAGNHSECSPERSYLEDSTPPAPPVLNGTSPPSGSDANEPTVQGTTEAGTTVRLYRLADCQSTPFESVPAPPEFEFRLSVEDDTTTVITADAVDRAGNVSGCSNALIYVEESGGTSVPTFTDTRPRSPRNENSPLLLGTVDDEARVDIYEGDRCSGAPVASVVGIGGTFEAQVRVADDSTTTFTAQATTELGPSACSAPITYVEDSVAPPAPLLDAIAPGRIGSVDPVLTGRAEAGTTVRLYGSATCTDSLLGAGPSDGTFSVVADVADNSETFIHGMVFDGAGNRSACVLLSDYTEDSQAPSVPTASLGPTGPANDNEPTITGTTEPGAAVEMYRRPHCTGVARPATVAGDGAYSITVPVGDDTTTSFSLRAVDAAGNTSSCTQTLTYVEDSTPPQFGGAGTVVGVAEGTAEPTLQVSWTSATDAVTRGSEVVYEVCHVTAARSCLDPDTWLDPLDDAVEISAPGATAMVVPAAGQGVVHRVAVRARDAVGNVTIPLVERSVRPPVRNLAESVASGANHVCVLSQGRVFCHGPNEDGETGDGEILGETQLTPVSGLLNVTAITGGGSHTCALLVSGTVSCWGSNASGELGDGTTTPRITPVPVAGLTRVVEVDAGNDFTCARRADGTVWCWGSDEYGILGGTGDSTTPVRVFEGDAAEITAGSLHMCLRDNVTVRCWGANEFSQTGRPESERETTPQSVFFTRAVRIEAGGLHTCALVEDGDVWCWGMNNWGQLGADGPGESPAEPQHRPLQVVGLPGGAVGLTAGGAHTCAWLPTPSHTDTGEYFTWCWGDNSRGQIYLDPAEQVRRTPTLYAVADRPIVMSAGDYHTCLVDDGGVVRCQGDGFYLSERLEGWNGPATATSVTVGGTHTCATDVAGGRVPQGGGPACWGDNGSDQIHPDWTASEALAPVARRRQPAVPGAIDAGAEHNCTATATGALSCVGADVHGQLGDGPTSELRTDHVRSVTSGLNHSCALLDDGSAVCWGAGGYGRLGNGSTAASDVPVPVDHVGGWAAIAAGGFHTCALTDGMVWCWGQNTYGQLGTGTTASASTPIRLDNFGQVVAISAGTYHTCALLADGTVRCWGRGSSGQLGVGTTANSLRPVAPAIGEVRSLVAGGFSTCAVLATGALRCWGDNDHGQLGDGTTTDRLVPTAIAGPAGWLSVDTGANHTCGIRVGGRPYCWGGNDDGQLGDGTTIDRLTPTAVSTFG